MAAESDKTRSCGLVSENGLILKQRLQNRLIAHVG